MAKEKTTQVSSQSYQKMVQELETIIQEVSSSDVDLDQIVTKVERGYGLVRAMNDKISKTKLRIESLRANFESGQDSPAESLDNSES